jgi:O-antigen/teichoic acid export membrane protein
MPTLETLGIERRFTVDFTWVLVGNIFYSACQWMFVVVLAKLGSPQQVGEYALGLAVAAPVILFANLQLRSLLASDVQDRFRFGQYVTFRLLSMSVALLVVAGIAGVTEGASERGTAILLVGVAQALEMVSDTYYGFMQKNDRMDRMSWSLMIRGPLSLAALWVAMYLTRNLTWTLLALVAARLAVLLAWDARLGFAGRETSFPLEGGRDDLLALLRLALPLGVISMLVSLNSNIPRYFVEAHEGSAQLGMYSAVASLLSAGTLVVSAYGQAMFLPVARACAGVDRSGFRRFAILTAFMGAALGGAAVLLSALFGRTILSILFKPEYGKHADVLVLLMVSGTLSFVASGWGFVVTAARSLRPQVPLLLTVGAVSAAAAWVLVPRYGLMGAAGAALAAASVQFVGMGAILIRVDRRLSPERAPAASVAHAGMETI